MHGQMENWYCVDQDRSLCYSLNVMVHVFYLDMGFTVHVLGQRDSYQVRASCDYQVSTGRVCMGRCPSLQLLLASVISLVCSPASEFSCITVYDETELQFRRRTTLVVPSLCPAAGAERSVGQKELLHVSCHATLQIPCLRFHTWRQGAKSSPLAVMHLW